MADGPLLHRRLLGVSLQQLRLAAHLEQRDVSARLRRRPQSIDRWEKGETLPDGHQLETLCEMYGAAGGPMEQRLFALHGLATAPAWWSDLREYPAATTALLAMEETAIRIRQYDHGAVPGLLQTPAYARANIEAVDMEVTPEQVEADVELRVQRQARVWQRPNPPDALYLVDEAALWRLPGAADARRAQLTFLVRPPTGVTVRVVPFSSGPHPSLASYAIFDLAFGDSDLPTKCAFVEGPATEQGITVEDGDAVATYEEVFERTLAKALTARQSARLLKERLRAHDD